MPRRHVSMREMKHDRFREAVFAWMARVREGARRRARQIGIAALVVAGIAVLVAIGFAYVLHGNRQTAGELADATKVLAGEPDPLGESAPAPAAGEEARIREALPKFQQTAGDHPGAPAGRTALYYAGILQMRLGETAEARSSLERFEKQAGGTRLAPLAQAHLARIAEAEKRMDEAERIWKDLIQADSPYLSADTAEMELARFYERSDRLEEARKTYGAVAGRTGSAWSATAGEKKRELDEVLGPEPPQTAPAAEAIPSGN